MKDSRGFTLVELLAVIVILALIMGIAVFSMSSVIDNTKISSFKSSAISFIDGIRKLMLANMDLNEGDYYISESKLQTSVKSPWGKYVYYNGSNTAIMTSLKNKGYAKAETGTKLICGGTEAKGSFIRIAKNASGNYDYTICLYDDANNYIFANEMVLLNEGSTHDNYFASNVNVALAVDATGKLDVPSDNTSQ